MPDPSVEKPKLNLKEMGFKKSSVSVAAEVITSEDHVDLDALSTRITVSAMIPGCSPDNIVGTIESKPFAAISISSENSLPNPPRK